MCGSYDCLSARKIEVTLSWVLGIYAGLLHQKLIPTTACIPDKKLELESHRLAHVGSDESAGLAVCSLYSATPTYNLVETLGSPK